MLIKHYYSRGKILSETKAKLNKYYWDSAPSCEIVQTWFTEFRCGCTRTETIPSPGRPNEITTPEMINKIHDIFLIGPKMKVREIAEIVSISTEHVESWNHVKGQNSGLNLVEVRQSVRKCNIRLWLVFFEMHME